MTSCGPLIVETGLFYLCIGVREATIKWIAHDPQSIDERTVAELRNVLGFLTARDHSVLAQ